MFFSKFDVEVLYHHLFLFSHYKSSESDNDIIWLRCFRVTFQCSSNLISSLLCSLWPRFRGHKLCPGVHGPFSASLIQQTASVYNQYELTCWFQLCVCTPICVLCITFRMVYIVGTGLARHENIKNHISWGNKSLSKEESSQRGVNGWPGVWSFFSLTLTS